MATKSNGKPLRFAALIRVSTERQERRGESLRTQTSQIDHAVTSLGGAMTAKYGGQEHATAGWERAQTAKLLADAARPQRPFDAVIVADATRWSRDNVQSDTGLEILRDVGVRFFVLTTEHDLYNPESRLFLRMSASFGAYQADTQKLKSILNRIERAKRAIPSGGKKPFGRKYERETGKWTVIPEQQAMIRDVAERYLAGEPLQQLADEYGVNYSNLTVTLRKRCGTSHTMRFKVDDLNVDESVTITVPRLLPEKTIRAVCRRLEAKRTYLHGSPKNEYLLGGRIFCAECNRTLTGAKYHSDDRYYRHATRDCHCPLRPRPIVRADLIETAVVHELFKMLGNPAAIERAVKRAVPDSEKALQRRDRLAAEVAKIEKARNRVLALIEKDAITDAQAEKKLRELKEREAAIRDELDALATTLACVADVEAAQQAALWVLEDCGCIDVVDDYGNHYAGGNDVESFLLLMDDEHAADRKALIAAALSGNLPDGKPAGVYVTPVAGGRYFGPKQFTYVLRGLLCGEVGGATQYARQGPARSRGYSGSGGS